MVLDASAVLAFFQAEPGAPVVARALAAGTLLSTVNLTEILTLLSERGTPMDGAGIFVRRLNCAVVSFDEDQAIAAAALRLRTRHLGLSLGDRACLALAAARGLPVLTADRTWAKLDLGIEVELIR
jgi:ribonuclease VapC